MQLTLNKHVGKNVYKFTFEGETLFEVVMNSQHLSFPDVYRCGMKDCESDLLYFRAHITKEEKFKYVKIICGKCRASLNLGQRKDDGSYFLRKDPTTRALAWEAYVSKSEPKSDYEGRTPPPGLTQPEEF